MSNDCRFVLLNRGKSKSGRLRGTAVKKRSRSLKLAHCAVLRDPNFRRFYVGYTVSLLGTACASVAYAFAVLGNGGTPVTLGYVLAAGIVPQVLLMTAGGVAADRFGRRRVMLGADVTRCLAQAALAAALLAGRPPIWFFAMLAAAHGTGEAFFRPALTALTTELSPPAELGNANAWLSAATSATRVAGPVLAGVIVAVASPAAAIAFDAVSFAVSVVALTGLRIPAAAPAAARPALLGELAEGWAEFRSRPWLLAEAVQFALFNLMTWGPYLVLGPVLARQALGGAAAWGAVMACYGAGCVLGGLAALGRRPRRPAAAAAVATFGFALPPALLAVGAPIAVLAAGALLAGAGSGLGDVFGTTALQQQVPPGALARVTAFETVLAFAFGPVAFAAAGPVASAVGVRTVLAAGAFWSVAGSAVVLALPSVRAVTWRDVQRRGAVGSA
jgi:MFS family permease